MKTVSKILIIAVAVVVVGLVVLLGYIWFGKRGSTQMFNMVPSDAIYVVEIKNVNASWEKISQNLIWQNLAKSDFFSTLNNGIEKINEQLSSKSLNVLLDGKRALISAHLVSTNDYSFLFFVDIEKSTKIEVIKQSLKYLDYSIYERKFKNYSIFEMTDKKTGAKFYLTFIENLIAASFDQSLIEKVLTKPNDNNWNINQTFKKIQSQNNRSEQFNLYINFAQLSNLANCYLSNDDENIKSISKAYDYSMSKIDLQNDQLTFEGTVALNENEPSCIRAATTTKPGKIKALKVASQQTSMYLSLTFADFYDYYRNLLKEFGNSKNGTTETYNGNIKSLEKKLKVNFHQYLFSWIGSEIAYTKLAPSKDIKNSDIVVFIHAKSSANAAKGIAMINDQIAKTSQVKNESVHYNEYEINHLNNSELFGTVFGEIFKNLDKPYFCMVDEFLVLSNSLKAIQLTISDYKLNRTLLKSKRFMDFRSKFEPKSNVNLFFQTPQSFEYLASSMNPTKYKSILANKSLINNFDFVGFQTYTKGEIIKLKISANFDLVAETNQVVELKHDDVLENLELASIQNLSFKISEKDDVQHNKNKYVSMSTDSDLKKNDKINAAKLNGLWKTLSEKENTISIVPYQNGKVNGPTYFYFDSFYKTIFVKCNFENDVLDGEYKEFYSNGKTKAILHFNKGRLNGAIEIFNNDGTLKMKGAYKNGVKLKDWQIISDKKTTSSS